MSGRIKLIVRKDAEGEYVRYNKLRFAISWGIPLAQAPSKQYPLMAGKAPDFHDTVAPRLLLYRYPQGEEFIGHADAHNPYTGPVWEDDEQGHA